MSSLLTNLGSLFSFLFDQMGSFATFFTNTTLGQVILGLVVFSVVASFITFILNKGK